MHLRKLLSPAYRFAIAKIWNVPFLFNLMLTRAEAKQLNLRPDEAKSLIEKFRNQDYVAKSENQGTGQSWAIKSPAPAGEVGKTWGDFYFAEELSAALQSANISVRVDCRNDFNNELMACDDVVLVIRGLEPFRPQENAINILWVISHPELVSKKEINEFDLVFAASSKWAKKMSKKTGKDVQVLLQATNPKIFNIASATPDTKPGVIFIGNSRNRFRKIVKDAIRVKLPIRIIGTNWSRFVPKELIEKEFIENSQLSKEYRSATYVLNDHWKSMKKNGFISNRLFDAAASGARIISDQIEGVSEIFGNSVAVYKRPSDLLRFKLNNGLSEFGDRAELDRNANTIGSSHSFELRAQELINAVKDITTNNSKTML